jgi:hypothetical protein
MPTVIDEVTAQVVEPPTPQSERPEPRGRQAPDMPRIQAELRREAERIQRLWCD